MTPQVADSMSAAAAPRPTARTPWSPSQSRTVSSTTPAGFPPKTPGSAAPKTPAKTFSPASRGPLHPSSPNYFEYISEPDVNPPNSNAGIYARRNWNAHSAGDGPKTTDPSGFQPLETQKRFENFRRESEGNRFHLSNGVLRQYSSDSIGHVLGSDVKRGEEGAQTQLFPPKHFPDFVSSPMSVDGEKDAMDIDHVDKTSSSMDVRKPTDLQRTKSSAYQHHGDFLNRQKDQSNRADENYQRHSLPVNKTASPPPHVQRAETVPVSLKTDGPTFIPSQAFRDILTQYPASSILLLDLRVSHQHAKSRIDGAINLCIPTTLLKRASYNIQRLSASFTRPSDRAKFDEWADTKVIAVYDASAHQMSDAASCINILKKFTQEHWKGATYIIRGGFNSFSKTCPEHIDHRPIDEIDGSFAQGLSLGPPAAAPVVGGCEMPIDEKAVNPFFGTIRQNMDLIEGVGQLPIAVPSRLKGNHGRQLPTWLRLASDPSNQGKIVADRFLRIEKEEQHRMKKALRVEVSFGSPNPLSPDGVQVAGIEKGMKNRYKDILPYDHTRVRLKNVPAGGCDYVNASHVQAAGSKKRYIASQAPIPATIPDFWRVAWEQDARVIVMLTAESEGGNLKCHPYWLPGDYGTFKIKSLSERRLSLERNVKPSNHRSFTAPLKVPTLQNNRPSASRRHSSKHSVSSTPQDVKSGATSQKVDTDKPHLIVRKLALSNTSKPFESLREITQLQYSSWPDFGAPADPAHVLGLVERCDEAVRSYQRSPESSEGNEDVLKNTARPVVVHCSAGCGRTGTFCTIDSVIDLLKQQRANRHQPRQKDSLLSPSAAHKSSPHDQLRPNTSQAEAEAEADAGVHDIHPTPAPTIPMDTDDSDDDDPLSSSLSRLPSLSAEAPEPATASEQGLGMGTGEEDSVDLITRTVESFRAQRLSMVQTLRQFVLCYESVLEWLVGEMESEMGMEMETEMEVEGQET